MRQQTCYKIRKLKETPEVTVSKVGKRNMRRDSHLRHELLIIQCAQCRLTLHRGYLPQGRLYNNQKTTSEPVIELERVKVKTSTQGATLFCSKCQSKVATVGGETSMAVLLHSLIMTVPEGPDRNLTLSYVSREPYCTIGALSGLSIRKIMAEFHRLAYTKQVRYRLTLRELFEKLRAYEARFKGLSNLILLNDNAREAPTRPLRDHTPPSAQKLEFDKMMRSTTVDHSNSRHNSKQRPNRSRRRDSIKS